MTGSDYDALIVQLGMASELLQVKVGFQMKNKEICSCLLYAAESEAAES